MQFGFMDIDFFVQRCLIFSFAVPKVFPFSCLFLAVHSCAISNGGCEHYCVQQSAAHFRCRCKPNYVLAEDGKHCKRECPNSGVRQH